ncbi:hypothetical protein HYW54_05390 [Candidatus Gottesmanbacteria bacterium]|nr:hypothetical protein [Candidatus Gottesmanbacteria bacterium]
MKVILSSHQIEVFADLFTNLASGFFGTLIIFPGIFGLRSPLDLLALLIINLPSGILLLTIALKLKEYTYES